MNEELIQVISKGKLGRQPRIMVIGDIMLDQYVMCDVVGQSPEDDIALKLRPTDRFFKGGGAVNVALNLDQLGAHVALIGRTGKDDARNRLYRILLGHSQIDLWDVQSELCPTTQKTRYMTNKQRRHVCRVDEECVSNEKDAEIIERFNRSVSSYFDLIVVSDYGKGVISSGLLAALRDGSVPYIVDPKRKNLKDYGPALAITPNEAEGMDDAGHVKPFFAHNMIVTRSEKGADVYKHTPGAHTSGFKWYTQGTRAREVGDPAGCGDSFVAALAVAVAQGATTEQAVAIGCAAGAVAYDHVGVHNVCMDELLRELEAFNYQEQRS